MWMKAFTHMSCQSIRMFETIFSSSKIMPEGLDGGGSCIHYSVKKPINHIIKILGYSLK